MQAGLVVIGDSLFVSTPTETLAIDPVTCRTRWQHSYRRAQEPGLQVNRGVAAFNGRVFRGTDDGRLFALDAANGREIWTSIVGEPAVVNAEQLVAFVLNPTGTMPKLFPEPRSAEDDRDLRDMAAYVANWPR